MGRIDDLLVDHQQIDKITGLLLDFLYPTAWVNPVNATYKTVWIMAIQVINGYDDSVRVTRLGVTILRILSRCDVTIAFR